MSHCFRSRRSQVLHLLKQRRRLIESIRSSGAELHRPNPLYMFLASPRVGDRLREVSSVARPGPEHVIGSVRRRRARADHDDLHGEGPRPEYGPERGMRHATCLQLAVGGEPRIDAHNVAACSSTATGILSAKSVSAPSRSHHGFGAARRPGRYPAPQTAVPCPPRSGASSASAAVRGASVRRLPGSPLSLASGRPAPSTTTGEAVEMNLGSPVSGLPLPMWSTGGSAS